MILYTCDAITPSANCLKSSEEGQRFASIFLNLNPSDMSEPPENVQVCAECFKALFKRPKAGAK